MTKGGRLTAQGGRREPRQPGEGDDHGQYAGGQFAGDRPRRVHRPPAGRRIPDPAAPALCGRVVPRRFRYAGHRLCRAGDRQGMGTNQRCAWPGVQRRPVRPHDRRTGVRPACGPYRAQENHHLLDGRFRRRSAGDGLRPRRQCAPRNPFPDRAWFGRCHAEHGGHDLGVQPAAPPRHHGHDHVLRLFRRCGARRSARGRSDSALRLARGVHRRRHSSAPDVADPGPAAAGIGPLPCNLRARARTRRRIAEADQPQHGVRAGGALRRARDPSCRAAGQAPVSRGTEPCDILAVGGVSS